MPLTSDRHKYFKWNLYSFMLMVSWWLARLLRPLCTNNSALIVHSFNWKAKKLQECKKKYKFELYRKVKTVKTCVFDVLIIPSK